MDSERLPTHRRTITVESFDDEDDHAFTVVGRLVDERPWATEQTQIPVLHEMSLVLKVDRASMTILDAEAKMHHFPHEECATIEPAFRRLVGLSVTRGYNRAVQDRLGRQLGCSHLEFLARAMGPAVIQSMASSASRAGRNFTSQPDRPSPVGWLENTCHLWATGGIGAEKMAMGWRPGIIRYPTPSLVELRRRRVDETASDA
jgi:hypothetical protein